MINTMSELAPSIILFRDKYNKLSRTSKKEYRELFRKEFKNNTDLPLYDRLKRTEPSAEELAHLLEYVDKKTKKIKKTELKTAKYRK